MAGDAEAAALVGGGHEAEQELTAGGVKRGKAELIEEDQIGAENALDNAPHGVVGEAPVEGLDEVGGGEVADPEAGLDGGVAESDQ